MRFLIVLLFFGFCACGQQPSIKKVTVDPEARKLNDSATLIIMQEQNYEKAISLLDQAIEIDSNYLTAYTNKVSFSLKLKQYDKALNAAFKLQEKKPYNPDYRFTTGMIYEMKGDSIASKKQFAEAAKLFDIMLDAMKIDSKKFNMLLMNKAINLIFMGEQRKGNEILKQLDDKEKDKTYREMLASYMNKSKQDILKEWFSPITAESRPQKQ